TPMSLFLSKNSRIVLFIWSYLCSALLCMGFGQNKSQKKLQGKGIGVTEDSYLVEFLLDTKQPGDKSIQREIGKALEYAKITYHTLSLKKGKKLALSETTKVLIVGNIDHVAHDQIEKLVAFVSRGGTLILTNNGETRKFGFLAGASFEANYEYDS